MENRDWISSREFYTFQMSKAQERGNPLNVVPTIRRFGSQGTMLFRAGKARFYIEGRFHSVLRDWDVPPCVFDRHSSTDDFDPFNGTLRAVDVSREGLSENFAEHGHLPAAGRLGVILDHLLIYSHDAKTLGYVAAPLAEQSSPVQKPKRAPGAGAKTDSVRWEMMAAAFAVLAEDGQLHLHLSETAIHELVATKLAERGHDDALSVDTVRSMIRRYKAWSAGHPFMDDADYDPG